MRILPPVLMIGIFFLLACQQVNKSSATAQEELSFTNLFDATLLDSVACYRIPSFVTAPNGDLIAVIDERVPSCSDLGKNKNINLVMRRSSDNGQNWSAIQTIVDYPFGKSASDPSMIVDQVTGTIFLFYNYMDLDQEPGIYYLHLRKSTDNGQSWSHAIDITDQITKSGWTEDFKFITSGRGTQTSEGTLIHCLVNLDHGMHLFGSKDHGQSWQLFDTPIRPANESKVIELSDGSWMINSRVQGKGLRYVHLSTDEGKTWTSRPDSTLIDPACNASILRHVHQGQSLLLFSNAQSKEIRQNLTIRISINDGQSWNKGKVIYPGGSAYSSMTILNNGQIGLLFEKDDYRENSFVALPVEWLME